MSAASFPAPAGARAGRRIRFGLDTVLPADPAVIEAAVLRLLQDAAPDVLAVRPSDHPDRAPAPGHRAVPPLPRGAPDLLLLAPGGRSACLKIKTQAARLTHDQTAFEALCRARGIPFAIVRSTAEAQTALARFGFIAGGA